jgi:pimeloyl-ACP methyl ester carboxylesterase
MSSIPVLFLPGLLCTGDLFKHQISRLPGGFKGQGCRLAPENSMELLAGKVWRETRGNPVLCGLSLGGIVCMEMYRQMPDRVRGLVLMDTNAMDENEAVSEERLRLLQKALDSSPGRVAGEFLYDKQVHPALRENISLKNRVIAMADEYGTDLFACHAGALSSRIDYSPVLGSIRCPVLILTGEEDRICPEEKQTHMESLIPGAERVRIPGAGHLSAMEQAEAVTITLNSWLMRYFP